MVRRTRQEYDRHANMPRDQNSNANEPCPRWAFDASTNQLSSSGFAYDAAGHLTTDVTGAATRTYAWDAEGRLTQVTDNGGNTTTSYVYNALGQEVELKTVGGWQLEQVFDPQGQRVGYYSAGGSQWLLAYVPWQGRELAKYASTTSFNLFHSNVLGSAAISTDQTGTVDDDMAFYPWGQVWLNSGSNTYDTHFAGIHASLQGSNLIDFSMDQASYRFYAPNTGRWHSPDPLASDITNPQSFNRYAYAMNNPASAADPTGLLVAPGSDWMNENNCTVDGFAMPCTFVGQNSVIYCGAYCGAFGQTYSGTSGGNGSYVLLAGVNGPVFVNGLNGEELSEEAAAEIGLSVPDIGTNPAGNTFGETPGSAGGASGGGTGGGGGTDPGCGPRVAGFVNQSFSDYQTTFSVVGDGWETGGNWNYTLQSGEMGPFAAADLVAEINSGPGWPPAASERFGDIPSLHVENATLLPGGTGVQFIAHIDTINPDTPLIGPPGHFTIDVVAGHVIQFLGGSLGCH